VLIEEVVDAAVGAVRFHLQYNVLPFHDARLRAMGRPDLGRPDLAAAPGDEGDPEDAAATPTTGGKKRKKPAASAAKETKAAAEAARSACSNRLILSTPRGSWPSATGAAPFLAERQRPAAGAQRQGVHQT
jgi:hypothetical protein